MATGFNISINYQKFGEGAMELDHIISKNIICDKPTYGGPEIHTNSS